MVSLRSPLQNGNIVEILTSPAHHPSRDWLAMVKTSRARSKIRAWIHTHERERSVALGRDLTEKELRKYRVTLRSLSGNGKLDEAIKGLGYGGLEDFYAAVGYGKVTPFQLVSSLLPPEKLRERKESPIGRAVRRALGLKDRKVSVKVKGMDDMLIFLARCCSPIRGEEIVGYITRGKGVSVHKAECTNVISLLYDPERKIEVEWETGSEAMYEVRLAVMTEDRQGILARIVSAIAEEKTNIKHVDAKTTEEQKGLIGLTLDISDRAHMERIRARLRSIEGVNQVERLQS